MTKESEPRDTSRITFRNAVPKQAARDISEAVTFYEQKLGFARTFMLDDYAGVARGLVEIHLWRCADRYIAENTACRVDVEGIEALYEEYRLRGVIHPNGALETTPWGAKEFTILDLDGNGITFCGPT
jgi:Glyoxalase/Bleomycin resistance protein/Dioxygenase superfamily